MNSLTFKWLALPALILCLQACEPVQPWERGDLAKPQMALDPEGINGALRAHTLLSLMATAVMSSLRLTR